MNQIRARCGRHHDTRPPELSCVAGAKNYVAGKGVGQQIRGLRRRKEERERCGGRGRGPQNGTLALEKLATGLRRAVVADLRSSTGGFMAAAEAVAVLPVGRRVFASSVENLLKIEVEVEILANGRGGGSG
ncbi:hypothetical protein RHGRI_001816 [Rhododendron griersonianum]|uniref:Uncharacterized protein n=1 Tax=Rhododendron griersonianum TaxID=479676 RepID=A0AAV6LP67_9ERIC|nr:hypothetical protein RHGRI_001816 [Rhododendron griersonianum]